MLSQLPGLRTAPTFWLYFFSLIDFLFLRQTKKEDKPLVLPYIISLTCFIFALLSKAVTVILPFVLASYVFCFLPQEGRKKSLIKILPFLATALLYFVFEAVFLENSVSYGNIPKIFFYRHALLVFKTVGYYLGLLILPVNLNAEHLFAIPKSLFEPAIYFSLTTVFIALALFVKEMVKKNGSSYRKMLSFGLLWILFTLLPSSNIIFLFTRPIAEQRLYIPSLGFCLVLAIGIDKISALQLRFIRQGSVRYLATYIFVFILLFYSTVTFRRNFDWKDSITLWGKTVESSPHSPRAHNNLGSAYEANGLYDEAIRGFKQAIRLNPQRNEFYYNLGNVYQAKGLYEQAISHYKQALELNPRNSEAHNNLGNVYDSKGLYEQAISHYKQSLSLRPQFIAACNNLGYLYVNRNIDLDQGIKLIKKALSLAPDNAEIMDSLGWAYYKKGMLKEALEQLKEADVLMPDNAEVHKHLGMVYRALGKEKKAVEYFQKVKELERQ